MAVVLLLFSGGPMNISVGHGGGLPQAAQSDDVRNAVILSPVTFAFEDEMLHVVFT